VECLDPEGRREFGLKEESACDIIRGADHALSSAILWGGVWARETERNVMG
jgi:hypothetical protein